MGAQARRRYVKSIIALPGRRGQAGKCDRLRSAREDHLPTSSVLTSPPQKRRRKSLATSKDDGLFFVDVLGSSARDDSVDNGAQDLKFHPKCRQERPQRPSHVNGSLR